jgi:hypothetical protein
MHQHLQSHAELAEHAEENSSLRVPRGIVFALMLAAAAATAALDAQQGYGQLPTPLPLGQSIRERGSSITGAFEGWYYDKDGGINLLVGYFNRNTKQELDIPVGAANRISPGSEDQGQPTHFLTGRQFGVFSIKVPKDFGNKELTWTLTANGLSNAITLHSRPDWIVEPYEDAGNKNTPPVLRFQVGGPTFTGPPTVYAATYSATVSEPIELTAWASDQGPKLNVPERSNRPPARGRTSAGSPAPTLPPPLAIGWSLFRGPAAVKFDPVKPAVDKTNDGKATTMATFAVPGEYILRVQANDQTGDGGGGFQCCWTNALVKVTVRGTMTER